MSAHPRAGLVNLIHSPNRLAILSALYPVGFTYFSDLREALGLTDAELSRQLATLEEAAMVDVVKVREKRKVLTRVRISESGRTRFSSYLDSLRQTLDRTVPTEDSMT